MSESSAGDTPKFPKHVPLVVIVSGPAGAGKTSLVNNLLESSDRFMRAVTCTCRPPRKGEVDGEDYHFLDENGFQQRLARGEFIENAKVYGYDYGMPLENFRRAFRQGKDLVINIDVQGAGTIRKRAKKLSLGELGSAAAKDAALADVLLSVFIMPPSMKELERRLKKRGTDDHETIQRRLAVVREEMKRWMEYDYALVSGSLADDLERIKAIVASERLRARRLALFAK